MDVLAACVCTAGYWLCLHLSRRDLLFFYWSIRDCVKASLDNAIFLDWTHRSSSGMRLIGHCILLAASAAVVLTSKRHRKQCIDNTPVVLGPWADNGLDALWGEVADALVLAWRAAWKTAVLFLGPIVEHWLFTIPPLHLFSWSFGGGRKRGSWYLLLEYVLAPVSEEVVFRRINFYLLRHRSAFSQVMWTGLLFSMAHVPKFCYFLCADIRSEAVVISTLPAGISPLPPDGIDMTTEESTALRFRQTHESPLSSYSVIRSTQPASSPTMVTYGSKGISITSLRRIQRSTLKDMIPGVTIPFLFGAAVGTFYLYAYDGGHVAPLIVIHEMCNLFGIPKFLFWREWRHHTTQWWIATLVGGCYCMGVLVWCYLMFDSFSSTNTTIVADDSL